LGTGLQRNILMYARRNLSPYVYVSSRSEKDSALQLGIRIPEVINDRSSDGSVLRFVFLDNVCAVKWITGPKKGHAQGPTRTEFQKQVKESYANIILHSQGALLPTLYGKMVRVPEVSMAMSPLRRILISLEELGRIATSEFEKTLKSNSAAKRYFTLLEDLRFIKLEGDYYVAGEGMTNLKAKEIEPPELYEQILGSVIEQRSKYLQEVLHWTMIVPYLRWSNSYYLPSYEVGRLVKMERNDLIDTYVRFHEARRPMLTYLGQIQHVLDVQILFSEGSCYRGSEEIFERYSRNADQEVVLQSVRQGRGG